ncbi:MAG: bifunctional folylpolyglutamate synthase/dihydrofolate synthase [Tannerella sp.]|jgi:dihydrofolate synthase/folylpolyglutamate synthase|nr:bifunctional folylpolyglutamate synthase/dihydrofolate synthase [Tannerella sp.]
MTYEETLSYLYKKTPAFHQVGAEAYKIGLERSLALDKAMEFPHKRYKTIHIAGTNGKGSVSHLLAAILQASGYKVGLYTSPHLVDFRERIRFNGLMISKPYVVEFVRKYQKQIKSIKPSFFEITSSLAFDYFRHKKVHYAIVETGMGGKLDSTNIITPILSIITSISFDHRQYLGNTLIDIANEKAGIIKRYIPVVIGEGIKSELKEFFQKKALEESSIISFASENEVLVNAIMLPDYSWDFFVKEHGLTHCELRGLFQKSNAITVLKALKIMSGFGIRTRKNALDTGFGNVAKLTGLMGRWEEISAEPKVVCDIGHNEGAWGINSKMLENAIERHDKLHLIIGVSKDKEIDSIIKYFPKKATYYFTNASIQRALPAEQLAEKCKNIGLDGFPFVTVKEAVYRAVSNASKNDMIFIGGSAFVVGEAYPLFSENTD